MRKKHLFFLGLPGLILFAATYFFLRILNSQDIFSHMNLANIELVEECKTELLYSVNPGFTTVSCTERWLNKNNYVLLLLQKGEKENTNKYKLRIISHTHHEVYQEEIEIEGTSEENRIVMKSTNGNYLIISDKIIKKIGEPFVHINNGVDSFGINWKEQKY